MLFSIICRVIISTKCYIVTRTRIMNIFDVLPKIKAPKSLDLSAFALI